MFFSWRFWVSFRIFRIWFEMARLREAEVWGGNGEFRLGTWERCFWRWVEVEGFVSGLCFWGFVSVFLLWRFFLFIA